MKNILIIAGSDSVGGAGIQADIKTCVAHKCYAATAISAITAQNTNGVIDVLAVSENMLKNQLKMITDELEIHAIKIGMLFNESLISCVSDFLENFKDTPIVIDPVCVAKSGAKLMQEEALFGLKELLKYATIATPNTAEAEILGLDFDTPVCDILLKRTKVDEICEDTLYTKSGKILKFSQPLLKPEIMHGAGCSFSTAIACNLALNPDKSMAINNARKFITNAIKHAITTKFGTRLLNHGV
ncbi:hydroxymethylpyrimidine/phosphomethylpyrimidine kinase [Campylobacter gastrosuis]|uniref:hydroxymethylpyrimidine kinase n=1 Tax=Campylobacter gastrosuis TaxID=2974576 RepID=A0ABT7HQW2_9BACT|nr:hydroxymethylpyrimidine/phosphomethylpyrimidine kinase [Campylobacter gastrosuis]MDL0089229.1 hydroxymethylpyrimidine/phosphomethylpyrimidine kinase [Campylobacter gastrosuis]